MIPLLGLVDFVTEISPLLPLPLLVPAVPDYTVALLAAVSMNLLIPFGAAKLAKKESILR